MHFFVVEVFPGDGPAAPPARIHVPELAKSAAAGNTIDVDLKPHFTGAWSRFRLLQLKTGDFDSDTLPSRSEVIHVLDGSAVITVDGERYAGDAGFSVAVPPRFFRRIENVDAKPLNLIITEVMVA
jgi:mannose-6-phosphate isomerase-like protein (cupin superfamily)